MGELFALYKLNYAFVFLAVLLSIASCYIAFAFSFAGCVIGSYIAIHMAYKKAANTLQYVSGGIVVIGSILTVGYSGFSMLFSAAVDYQPVLVCLTVLLVTARFRVGKLINSAVYESVFYRSGRRYSPRNRVGSTILRA
jgi:hypothetical protein